MPNPGTAERSHTSAGCPGWTPIEVNRRTSTMQAERPSELTAWSVYKEEVNDRYQRPDFPNTRSRTRRASPSPGPTTSLDASKLHC